MKKALLSFFLVIVMMFVSFPSAEGQYDTDRFMFRGRMALSEGKYAEAIDVFNILIRIDPEMYEAYFFRGIAKYNLEDFMGATSDFDKTLSMNPLYTPAYHYRAITYSRTGKYDEAIRDLDEAMDLSCAVHITPTWQLAEVPPKELFQATSSFAIPSLWASVNSQQSCRKHYREGCLLLMSNC